MSDFPSTVVDDDGNVHHLLKQPLGRGGQGVVLRTRSPHIAVKLIGAVEDAPAAPEARSAQKLWGQLTKAPGIALSPDAQKHSALRRRLEDVRALPLPGLHLAQPLSMLRDHVGYTMRLLTGMVPMRTLIAEPGTAKLGEFYQSSGGLGRRLELLANTAGLLARLHAVPLVYADVSPNNVFISETAEASEVWLIDLDNLDYLSANAPGIFTPGFGAPELVTGRAGVSTLSDSYSFAILAFWVLTQQHPFLGDYVDEGGWDDDGDEDREQLAFRGELPWIEDAADDSNRASKGIARHLGTFEARSRAVSADLRCWSKASCGAAEYVRVGRGTPSGSRSRRLLQELRLVVRCDRWELSVLHRKPARVVHPHAGEPLGSRTRRRGWGIRGQLPGRLAQDARRHERQRRAPSRHRAGSRRCRGRAGPPRASLEERDRHPSAREPRGPRGPWWTHAAPGRRAQAAAAQGWKRTGPAFRPVGPPPPHGCPPTVFGGNVKIDQVPYGQLESLRLRWTSASGALPNAAAPGAEALLQFSEREAQATLRVGGEVLGVQGNGRKHEVLLDDLCTRHFPHIAWVVDAGAQVLTLQVHTFLHALTLPPIELGIDEKTLETLERIDRKLASPERALDWLDEQFFLDGEAGRRGFATAESTTGAFALFGRTARAFIRRVKRPDSTEGLLVDRVARGRGQGGEQLALVSGDVRFVDATVAGKLRVDAAAQLSSLVSAGSSFLDMWSRYGSMENEAALRRARRAGWLKYDHVESLPDGRYRFSLANDCTLEDADQFKRTLTEEQGLGVEAVSEVPEVLTREMSWAEYRGSTSPEGYLVAGDLRRTRGTPPARSHHHVASAAERRRHPAGHGRTGGLASWRQDKAKASSRGRRRHPRSTLSDATAWSAARGASRGNAPSRRDRPRDAQRKAKGVRGA